MQPSGSNNEQAAKCVMQLHIQEQKALRWYGHVCRQADDGLTKCMLFGQVKGPGHVGNPRKIWNDVVLSHSHDLSMSCPYQVAQNKSAW